MACDWVKQNEPLEGGNGWHWLSNGCSMYASASALRRSLLPLHHFSSKEDRKLDGKGLACCWSGTGITLLRIDGVGGICQARKASCRQLTEGSIAGFAKMRLLTCGVVQPRRIN